MLSIQSSSYVNLLLGMAPLFAFIAMPAPAAMAAVRASSESSLSGDALAFVGDKTVTHLIAKIERVDFQPSTAKAGLRNGVLVLRLVDVLSPSPLLVRGELSLPFHQRSIPVPGDSDAWNRLDLSSGKLLLLAVGSPDGGKHWRALSGSSIASLNDPLVVAVRQAVLIDRSASLAEKEDLLKKALMNDNTQLSAYAAQALAERKVLGAGESARLLATAIHADALPQRQMSFLVYASRSWFGPEPPTDLAAASTLLGAMAQAFIDTRSSSEREYQAAGLAYALKSLPAATRKAIVAGVQTPAPSAVEAALHGEVNIKANPDAGTRKDLSELLQLWQSAHATR